MYYMIYTDQDVNLDALAIEGSATFEATEDYSYLDFYSLEVS